MLQDLSNNQLEQALSYLVNPQPNPPQQLKELSQVEWYLLQRLLEDLMYERDSSPLH